MTRINYIQLAYSILCLSFLLACQTTQPLDLGDKTPRIVINALATNEQKMLISLSESIPTGVSSPTKKVYYPYDHPNCPYKAVLKVNGRQIPLSAVADYRPHPKDQIDIQVSKSGLTTAYATTIIPTRPTVGSITAKKSGASYDAKYAINALGAQLQQGQSLKLEEFEISIPLQNAQKADYYRIVLEVKPIFHGGALHPDNQGWYQVEFKNQLLAQFSKGDLFGEYGSSHPMNLLAGSVLPSSSYTLTTPLSLATQVINKDGTPDYEHSSQEISDYVAVRAVIYAITSDLYNYWLTTTMARYNRLSSVGLSEPVLIYNNIKDGLGILGSMTASNTLRHEIKTRY